MEKLENKPGLIARYAKIITVVAVVFGATSGILGSLVEAPSMVTGFWRLTVALPFFLVPVLVNNEKRGKLKNVSGRDLFLVPCGGSIFVRPLLFMVQRC